MNSEDSRELLEALRSADSRVSQKAIESLMDMLDRVARGALREKQNRAGMQPESVVQSVLANHLERVKDAASNDGELEAWLKREVRRKAIDRVRHQQVRDRVRDHSDEPQEPAADGPGPSSIVRRQEDHELVSDGARELAAWLSEVLASDEERVLCNDYFIGGMDAAIVANRLGINAGTLRTRASRLRSRLMDQFIASIQHDLDAASWALARLIFCNALKPAAAAEQLGQSAEDVEPILAERVIPAVRRKYGTQGVTLLLACRKSQGGAKSSGSRE